MRAVGLLAIPLLGASLLCARDLSTYRGLQLGMNVAAVTKLQGSTTSEARTVYQRPAVIQEMDWRPRTSGVSDPHRVDPVRDGTLYFFNGELFRVVITYDRYKVDGMTAGDMIEGISAIYGPATQPAGEINFHSLYGESAPVLARWEDPQYVYNLVETGDHVSFALILSLKSKEVSAQAAIAEAVRLDAAEAPQRELARQIKHDADAELERQKARLTNKQNFHP